MEVDAANRKWPWQGARDPPAPWVYIEEDAGSDNDLPHPPHSSRHLLTVLHCAEACLLSQQLTERSPSLKHGMLRGRMALRSEPRARATVQRSWKLGDIAPAIEGALTRQRRLLHDLGGMTHWPVGDAPRRYPYPDTRNNHTKLGFLSSRQAPAIFGEESLACD